MVSTARTVYLFIPVIDGGVDEAAEDDGADEAAITDAGINGTAPVAVVEVDPTSCGIVAPFVTIVRMGNTEVFSSDDNVGGGDDSENGDEP